MPLSIMVQDLLLSVVANIKAPSIASFVIESEEGKTEVFAAGVRGSARASTGGAPESSAASEGQSGDSKLSI